MSHRLSTSSCFVATALCCATSVSVVAAEAVVEQKRSYSLPPGDAATTLNQFASASGQQIVFMMKKVQGERTNAVAGVYTAQEALDRMLIGTGLNATRDPTTGAFVVSRKRTVETAPRSGMVGPESNLSPNPKVNTMKSSRPLIAALAAWFALGTVASAQTAATPPSDETIVLSPFIVSAASDSGWRATQTLAGSRLKTDFADVASQISVMTDEFLKDIGAFDSNDAFLYSINTETEAEQAGATTQFMGSGSDANNPASRTRGTKGGTTTTKNFFRTDIPNNFYNSNESGLTIASGPNAILFGLGASGGLADTGYNRAQMRRVKGKISLTTDLEGSLIGSLDYNQPLIKDKLAARIAILDSQKKFPIKPAYEDDKRLYGTVGWALNDKVRFDVLYEYMDRETSRPVYFAPTDYVTSWVNPGLGNRTPYNLPDISPATTANASNPTNAAYWANPGSTAYLNNWSGQDLIGPAYTYGATDSPGIYYYRFTPTVRKVADFLGSAVTKQLPGLSGNYTLINEAEYPFSKYSHYGASLPSRAIGKRLQGQMMVSFTKDLFLEASFGTETNSQKSYSLYNGTNAVIEIDPSAYAYNQFYVPLDPTTTVIAAQTANRAANAAARTTNSNLGKLFVTSLQNGAVQERTIDEARVSLAYLFDAQKQFGKSWLRHLGAHQFSGNLGYSEITRIGQGFRRAIKDNVDAAGNRITPANIGIAAANSVGATTWMDTGNSNSRLFRTRVYIDPNNPDTRYDKGLLAGMGQDPWGSWTFKDATGTPFNVGLFDLGGANGANNSGAARGIYTDDISKALSWQGYLLNRRLVVTYGKRWDSIRSKLPDPLTTTLARMPDGLYPYMEQARFLPYESKPTFVNETKSVVLHPLKGTNFDYFSLHYNESTNNEAEPAEKWDMDGLAVPFPEGITKDFGISFNIGNFRLRLNRYENSGTNVDAGNEYGNEFVRRPVHAFEQRFLRLKERKALALGLPAYDDYYLKGGPDNAPGFNASLINVADFRVFSDGFSRGDEVELQGKVGKVSMRITVGRSQSVRTNVGKDGWADYGADPAVIERMKNIEWYAVAPGSTIPLPVTGLNPTTGALIFGAVGAKPLTGWENVMYADSGADASKTIRSVYLADIITGTLKLRQLEGTSNPAIREWRFNANFNYDIGKGWKAGTSIRMRDKGFIAYQQKSLTAELAGETVTVFNEDISQPIYNDREWYLDPFIAYTRKLSNGHKITYRLNVRNALGNDDITSAANHASDASILDPADPRFAYYGWEDGKNVTRAVLAQDPLEARFTVTYDF